jgi:RNA recognition motif-containing protein
MSDNSIIIKNLDPRVTEDELRGIFALISPIAHVKITKDNSSNVSLL